MVSNLNEVIQEPIFHENPLWEEIQLCGFIPISNSFVNTGNLKLLLFF